jgi:hypothetical protein
MTYRSPKATACLFAFTLLCVAGPAWADDETTAMQSMQDFLHNTPDCAEFTDQCSFCKLADGKAMCSTPSTACIKKDYVCTRKAAD